MGTVHSLSRPLGNLHDPLFHIVERIQGTFGDVDKIVSTDWRGNLFISDIDAQAKGLELAHQIIGTYNIATPLTAIEADLRFALRERARAWILDWDLTAGDARHRYKRGPRKRRVRAARMQSV